jgi:hypothetical protein
VAFIKRTGQFLWRGDIGSEGKKKESISRVDVPLSATAVQNFMQSVEPHSECNGTYFLYSLWYNWSVGAPGTGANIDKKALIYFRDPADLSVKTFYYPDPIAADIEVTPWGKKIKDSVVSAIVGYLNTMTGLSYVPLYGIYYQRK